jgi:hypothetical protein
MTRLLLSTALVVDAMVRVLDWDVQRKYVYLWKERGFVARTKQGTSIQSLYRLRREPQSVDGRSDGLCISLDVVGGMVLGRRLLSCGADGGVIRGKRRRVEGWSLCFGRGNCRIFVVFQWVVLFNYL